MKISGIIWLHEVVDKLLRKHNVSTNEVEEVSGEALVISARDMTRKERRAYAKARKARSHP